MSDLALLPLLQVGADGAGSAFVAVSGAALAGGIYAASRRNAVTAVNVNDAPRPAIPDEPAHVAA